jgi:hypothetical protein
MEQPIYRYVNIQNYGDSLGDVLSSWQIAVLLSAHLSGRRGLETLDTSITRPPLDILPVSLRKTSSVWSEHRKDGTFETQLKLHSVVARIGTANGRELNFTESCGKLSQLLLHFS